MGGEVIKTWLEILTSAGVVIGTLWKFAYLPLRNHIRSVTQLLSKIPVLFEDVQQQKKTMEGIYKKIYPNGGSSLDDKLNQIITKLHYQGQSQKVAWKLSPEAICCTDAKGMVTFVNYAWLVLSGFSSPEEAYGIGWVRAIHPEDRIKLKEEWEDTVSKGSALQTTFRMKNVQTGKVTLVNSHCNIIRDTNNIITEYFAVLTPQTQA